MFLVRGGGSSFLLSSSSKPPLRCSRFFCWFRSPVLVIDGVSFCFLRSRWHSFLRSRLSRCSIWGSATFFRFIHFVLFLELPRLALLFVVRSLAGSWSQLFWRSLSSRRCDRFRTFWLTPP